MSSLLKGEQAGLAVDRLPTARPQSAAPIAPVRDPGMERLEARVAELEQALGAERRESKRLIAEARAAGRQEATSDDARRIEALKKGLADAVGAWTARLAQIDGLAAGLAAAGLAKAFGEGVDPSALVALTLSHHVERLERHAVVSVGVSSHDFPAVTDVEALAAATGLHAARVAARPDLPAGACRIALRLGEVELDPTTQWRVLEAALAEMEEGR